LRHRTILFSMVLYVNSLSWVIQNQLCVWRSSLDTTKYPALHKNAVANGTFKQISARSCVLSVAQISSKPHKCRSHMIVSTKSSRVLECWRNNERFRTEQTFRRWQFTTYRPKDTGKTNYKKKREKWEQRKWGLSIQSATLMTTQDNWAKSGCFVDENKGRRFTRCRYRGG